MMNSISEFPFPSSLATEAQAIADIISFPESLRDAERILTQEMFTDERCREAFGTLRSMAKEGTVIDLPTAYGRVDHGLIQSIIPLLGNSASSLTAQQHFAALKDFDLRRRCYARALSLLMGACDNNVPSSDLMESARGLSEELRREMDGERGMQHISQVLNEVGESMEELQREREKGKTLRIPTGFPSLDFYTYGGFNAGNFVILAARPSVGKTAVMLQMAKAAANAGMTANVFSLEMTNQELAQRFMASEDDGLNQWSMAKGDVEWSVFERVVGRLSGKPIYLNDSARTMEEITSRITLNVMAGKCRIAFIDYLGLIKLKTKNCPLAQALAECTQDLKALAKDCKIPIVLLCQLNRASAAERRPPEMYDLRDSGSIEQDADIVLMLERAAEDTEGKEVNMWVRKNRQGKAGNVNVTIVANDSFSSFLEKGEERPYHGESTACDDFDNNNSYSDFPY